MFIFNRIRAATIGTTPEETPKPIDKTSPDTDVIDDGNGGEYPAVRPNGSLMLAWQVKNRRVLVVGGGNV